VNIPHNRMIRIRQKAEIVARRDSGRGIGHGPLAGVEGGRGPFGPCAQGNGKTKRKPSEQCDGVVVP